jgi:hypothetical protein
MLKNLLQKTDFIYTSSLFLPVILILWGSLAEGFLFTLDSQFTVNYNIANLDLSYDLAVIKYLLAFAADIFNPKLVQLFYFTFCLYIPSLLAFLTLKKYISKPAALISALFILLNPFIYEKLVAGHIHLILGMGMVIPLIHLLISTDTLKTGRSERLRLLKLLIVIVIGSIITPHMIWFFLIPAGVTVLNSVRSKKVDYSPLTLICVVAIVEYLFLSTFAIDKATNLQSPFFTNSIFSLFIFSGMWTEKEGYVVFALTPVFVFSIICLYSLFIKGIYKFLKDIDHKSARFRFFSILLISGLIGILLACLSIKEFEAAYQWLFRIPGFAVMREGHKWLGLYNISFVAFVGLAIDGILKLFSKNPIYRLIIICLSCLLIISFGYQIFSLAQGQIKLEKYPLSWEYLERLANDDRRILVLPWSGYGEYEFVDGMYMADPSRLYFSNSVISARFPSNMSYLNECHIQDIEFCINYDSTKEEWNKFVLEYKIGYMIVNKTRNENIDYEYITDAIKQKIDCEYVLSDKYSTIFFISEKTL